MKKSILAVLLIMSALVLAGCSGDNQPVQQKGGFVGGSEGVKIKFEQFGVQEDGTYAIFDSETFPLEVTLSNKGEYAIKKADVTVKLLGPDQAEMDGVKQWELKNTQELEEVSELVPNGGEETITFATDAKYKKSVKGFLDREWFANVEYNYETYVVVPEVCLKEDLTDKRVCEVKEKKTHFTSGAPVTVTSVDQSTAGRGVMALKFKVKKNGNGKLAKQGEKFEVQDRIGYTLDDQGWECKSGGKAGEARLINGDAEIICRLKTALAADTLSTKQVQLTLQYQYRDVIQEKLRIKESK